MAKNINKVIITGNLTRDPELRSTASGLSVLSIGVAVNDSRKNASTGEWQEYPNYIDCKVFGARAESLSKYLSKGSRVAIEGKLSWSSWETKEGQKRSKIEVVIDELEFLSPRNSGNSDYQPAAQSDFGGAPAAEAQIPAAPEITVYDEDIPF
jgi:single-strand DNA-binding protein